MPESKKRPGSATSGHKSPSESSDDSMSSPDVLSRDQMEKLSALQLVDMIVGKLPPRHSSIMDMIYLRDRVAEIEEVNDQARQTIEKMDAIIEKLRSPAFRVGTFLMPIEPDKAHVVVGGTD